MGAVESLINTLAFPAPPRNYSEALLRSRPDLVFLQTASSKRIPAIHKRAARPEQGTRHTILYSHGNAEDVGIALAYIDELSHELACDVFAYEYVGYSISDGEPSEAGVYESIDAAVDYLTGECGVPLGAIVVFGRSLGSAPTVHIASTRTGIAGMVLQSPLASGLRVMHGVGASMVLKPFDPFQNYAKVKRVRCPAVVMHGTADEVVPFWNGQSLHETLQRKGLAHAPLWAENHGHNDMPEIVCMRHVRSFLQKLPTPPQVKASGESATAGSDAAPTGASSVSTTTAGGSGSARGSGVLA